MAKEEFHWFPLYYQRFMLGTIGFSTEEIGAYILLLCYQWDNGFIPDDGDKISEIARVKFFQIPRVMKKFRKTKKGFRNDFLERVRREQYEFLRKRSESGRKAGLVSAEKRKRMSTTVERPLNDRQQKESKVNKSKVNKRESEDAHAHDNSSKTQSHEKNNPITGDLPGQTTDPPEEKKIAPGNPGSAPQSVQHDHLKKFKASTSQVEAFAIILNRANYFPDGVQSEEKLQAVRNFADEYWPTFVATVPNGDYSKWGYRFGDFLQKKIEQKKEMKKPRKDTLYRG